MILDRLRTPIVLAPLAGGPSTPALTAAVSNAGGLGFLAAGYLSSDALIERIVTTRRLTAEPFGVNVFVPSAASAAPEVTARYAAALRDEARAHGVELGEPRHDDDDWDAKVAGLIADPVPVVSFTFGPPPVDSVQRLHRVGSEVWVTVTSVTEALTAAERGADVLVVQGAEAGGHRGGTDDDAEQAAGLLALLQLVAAEVDRPLVAGGGIATGAAVAAVLCAGASAAAVGTAFLDCPEAGTSAVHRAALHGGGSTALTRAFTGRTARGIRNAFLDAHSAVAPNAYPEVHHLTAPLRRAGRESGNASVVNLWAGEAYPLIRSMPAADLLRSLDHEMRASLQRVHALIARG